MQKNLVLRSICFMLGLALLSGCGEDFGKKIVIEGTEIYFDGTSVTKPDAERLGSALKTGEFIDGGEKSVRLQRDGGKWIFQMITMPKYLESSDLDNDFEMMCLELSAAFDGQPFEVHGCDDRFTTKKKFNFLNGKRTEFGKGELYYNSLTDEQFKQVKSVLDKLGFQEFEGTLYFGKSSSHHEFRMICKEEFQQDEEIQRESKIWQREFSKAIGGTPVVVMLCNEYFEPQFTRGAE